jgi:hypothetical protein
MLIDVLYYGLISPGPDPYSKMLGSKILYTLILAIPFGHLYNKVSRTWRPNTDKEAFLYNGKVVAPTDLCKSSWPKIANGLVFSLLTSLVIIMSLALGAFFLSVLYISVLHGIRGDFPVPLADATILAGKLAASGIVLEWKGRTESDPRG